MKQSKLPSATKIYQQIGQFYDSLLDTEMYYQMASMKLDAEFYVVQTAEGKISPPMSV